MQAADLGRLRAIVMLCAVRPTSSPSVASRPVSSGVTLTAMPGFSPMALAATPAGTGAGVAPLAISTAALESISRGLPWPKPFMRSAQTFSAV